MSSRIVYVVAEVDYEFYGINGIFSAYSDAKEFVEYLWDKWKTDHPGFADRRQGELRDPNWTEEYLNPYIIEEADFYE